MEQMLALASDTGEDTWLQRLSTLSGDGLIQNLSKYCPETEGMDVAESAAYQYLNQHYGDSAKKIANQWQDLNEEMLWYEEYCEAHNGAPAMPAT